MIIVNDFFKRRKEAVSNQMELIAKYNDCDIVSATRFMNQKALQKEDLNDKIYVYKPLIYPIKLFEHVLKSTGRIHLFEEEPSKYKELLFNMTGRDLYISIYRMPSKKECFHLKKYKYLKGIFVEMDLHKQKLIKCGLDEKIIHLTPTPTKFERKENNKKYNQNDVKLLFASWNMSEGNPLYDRGLLYLLDMLKKNNNLSLTVILRDNKTLDFIKEINNRNLSNRVRLVDVESDDELEKIFEDSDFVAFPAQKRIVKDVPNSLIDGLCKGKPVIISNILNFSDIVKEKNIGIVIDVNSDVISLNITEEEYYNLSSNAYNYSKAHSKNQYVKMISKEYK